LFDRFRFLNTTFDGFDFGAYREALNATGWRILRTESVPCLDPIAPSPGLLESTYLEAKNEGNDIGDTKAAAEFFRREMLFCRRQYRSATREGSLCDRITAL
jgi:hypothetical protein